MRAVLLFQALLLLATSDAAMVAEVARVRHIKPHRSFVVEESSREAVTERARALFLGPATRALAARAPLYKRLGLVGEDIDLTPALVDRATGFFDPGSKRVVVGSWLPEQERRFAIARAAAHGLLAQKLDTKKLLAASSTDELLARR